MPLNTAQAGKRRNSDYRIALRPDDSGMTDDVVVNGVSMFRAEMMDDGSLWMCCYLEGTDDERIDFWVTTKSRRGILHFFTTDLPRDESIVYEDDEKAATCFEWRP